MRVWRRVEITLENIGETARTQLNLTGMQVCTLEISQLSEVSLVVIQIQKLLRVH
jgi:hypothetical protein